MGRVRKLLLLLVAAGIPAAALPVLTAAPFVSAPHPCFTAGSVTYRVAPRVAAPDYRVRIGESHPELRMRLVDEVENADFALVDDVGAVDDCKAAGLVKTVKIVGETSPADITMSLSRDGTDADLKLFVHSERFGQHEAAALFAAMRLDQHRGKLVQIR